MKDEKVLDVVLVRTEEQDVLYVDGDKVSSDGAYDLPDYINGRIVKLRWRYRLECDQNWEDNGGELPETFDELLENEYMWDEDHRNDEDDDDN